jgi:hypothetical protein
MARTVTERTTMNHLAFIRLLHQQAIEQTQQPEPLNLASLLTFHDCVELFLVLAADHLGAHLPRRDPGFIDYWQILQRTEKFPAGVDLSGQSAMDRLNRHRNALKHVGAFPGREAVEDARSSVSAFFEENTPTVFAVDFAAIDMADVVQEPTRGRIKAAAAAEAAGDRKEAMAQLAEAFDELFHPYSGSPTGFPRSYGFGPTVSAGGFPIGLGSAMNTVASNIHSNHSQGLRTIGQKADKQIDQLKEAVAAIQRGMRVVAMGIDYTRYDQFTQLTPQVYGTGEDRRVDTEAGYAPNRDEYEDCVQFVITVALRVAELQAHTAQPSWHLARSGWRGQTTPADQTA